ncbi:MAG TPA: hypothetical protein VH374_11545 [Polyangia bacterium]|nr:hypothetical protein [Polyangia bacterium]
MTIVVAAPGAGGVGLAAAGAESPAALVDKRGGVTIDWATGTVAAQAGAAADLRMPSADLARPGAERRARASALEKLRTALSTLPLGGDRTLPSDAVERALAKARVGALDYQSNGGVLVRLEVRFADWLAPASSPVESTETPSATIVVSNSHLAASPVAKVGKHEVIVGAATYHLGIPPASVRAISARADRAGRLSMLGDEKLAQKLAGALVVIYVEKVNR